MSIEATGETTGEASGYAKERATAGAATRRNTPISIIGMSGLKPIMATATGLALVYAACALAWAGAPLVLAASVLAGLLLWTFLEYILHRWMLHWEPQDPLGRTVRRCFPSHRSHHDAPLNERKNIKLQLRITVGLSLAFTAAMMLAGIPVAGALGLSAGVLLGYQAYEYVHVACHHLPMRNAWARTLKRHHAIHHHRDETVNFGVTTTVWDAVFRTTYRAAPSR